MSLLRVFDVMCWMFSWEGEHGPCSHGYRTRVHDHRGEAETGADSV